MKSRDLLSAIGKIDDKYVKSAEKSRNTEDKKRVFSIIRTVAAAVFAVAVIGTVWVISYKNVISKTNPAGTQSDSTDPITDTAPDLLSAAKKCLMQSDNKKVYYAKDGKSYYKDDLRNIYFCINVGDNYVLEVMTYGVPYPDGPSGADIGAYHFYYPAGYGLIFVNAADGAEHHLYNAYYDEKLINDGELSEVYYAYNEFINIFYKTTETDEAPETFEIIPGDYLLFFNETDKITDKDKAAELKALFENYLRDKSNPDGVIELCIKLSDGKYAAKLNNILRITAASRLQHIDVAGGYPIIAFDYGEGVPDERIIVLSGDDIFYGAETAYNRGIISDSDAYTIYNECRYKYYDAYYSEITGLLYRSMTEFLNGRNEADNKSGTGSKTTYYKFINISFCLKLRDEKYAVIYYVNGEPSAAFESMDVDIKGYKFVYKDGAELFVYDSGIIKGASHADLTDDEAARLYEAYNKYINARPGDRAKAMTAALDSYMKACRQFLTIGDAAYQTKCPAEQKAGMYNDYYVRSCFTRVVDGQTRYYAFISDPDENFHMTIREEKIGGLTFNYSTSENLKVIIGEKVYNSLREAYDAGVMSKRELEAVYTYLFRRA